MPPPPVYGDAEYPHWLTRLTVDDLIKLCRPNLTDHNPLRAVFKRSRSKHAVNLVDCHDKQVIQRVVEALQDDTLRLIGDPTRPGARVDDCLVLARDHASAKNRRTRQKSLGWKGCFRKHGYSVASWGPLGVRRKLLKLQRTQIASQSRLMVSLQLSSFLVRPRLRAEDK